MNEPRHGQAAFRCPFCGAIAGMKWANNGTIEQVGGVQIDLRTAGCDACSRRSIWRVPATGKKAPENFDDAAASMVFPLDTGAVEPPSLDMPAAVAGVYREAAAVLALSPRSAAALLRLALQMLLVHLGLPGENINQDIAELVRRGLPVVAQQAMDIVRVVGNNAVHPGQIDLDEERPTAVALFSLLNLIVETQIAVPKRVQAMFDALPPGPREAVVRRDRPRDPA